MKFKKFVLKHFPTNDFPKDLSCFDLKEEAELDQNSVQEGQALIRIHYISIDPLLRTWISGAKSYLDPVKPGSSIPGFGLAKVVKIVKKKGNRTIVETGDWVVGMLQWSQFMIIDYKLIQKLPVDLEDNMYKFLTIYGPTGFTSFWSIKREIQPFQIWNPKVNRNKTPQQMNILISSVAGGIGLTVTQYLSKLGYVNIYGIAGSDQKCKVAQDLGCKGTINYRKYYKGLQFDSKSFEKDIFTMMGKEKIDIYYENVGEDMLSSALTLMADNSKIIMCGATATYNSWGDKTGIRNYENIISKRIEMKGILYYQQDFNERIQVLMQMGSLEMKGCDVLIKGIEKLPESYRDMIDGKFIGKPVVFMP